MNNKLMMEESECPECGEHQIFYAEFEVNEIAKCLDTLAPCHICDHVAVISFDIETLLQSSGELKKFNEMECPGCKKEKEDPSRPACESCLAEACTKLDPKAWIKNPAYVEAPEEFEDECTCPPAVAYGLSEEIGGGVMCDFCKLQNHTDEIPY